MSKEAMLTAEVAVLTELVRVLSDKVNELQVKQEQKPVAWWDGKKSVFFPNEKIYMHNKEYWTYPLYTTPPQRTWVGLMRGVRVEGDNVIISVHYGNDAARQVCGALIEEMNK